MGCIIIALLSGFSPTSQTSDEEFDPTALCFIYSGIGLMWIFAFKYWYSYYKVRGRDNMLPWVIFVTIIFNVIAILGAFIHAIWIDLFSEVEIGRCPQCEKNKVVREARYQVEHASQPYCPHCSSYVGPGAKPPYSDQSISETIVAIQQLYEQGLISLEEFEAKKKDVLSRL